jgi:hypothetical protein
LLGGYDKMKANSSTNIVWQELLGSKGDVHLLKPMSVNDAVVLIQNAVAANRMVVLSTLAGDKASLPMIVDVPGQPKKWEIYQGHAYIVQSINAGMMTLYNPWGTPEDHANVPIMWIKELFSRAQIH